ncbi:hypothetical protein [Streptomyces sp. NBC_00094]|nr:hypothetical protein [Streptomyces sp. NBC_00094]MCX5395072.1 hypothetical protein [Streptomyces sp. NBC_00094]
MSTPRTRTPQEVFADHGRRLGTGDLDLISAQTVRHTLSTRTN